MFLSCLDEFNEEIEYCIASPRSDFVDKLEIPSALMESFNIRLINSDVPKYIGDEVKLSKMAIHLKYEDFNGKSFSRKFIILAILYCGDEFFEPIDSKFVCEDNVRVMLSLSVEDA